MVELTNLGNPMRLIPNKSDPGAVKRAFTDEVAVLNEQDSDFKLTGAAVNSFCLSFDAECIL